ncbi:protein phyllopod [Ceratitis capitata]|uniref:protein phyllopod n=1 Tax=Ceratitis capitata TaxID=7213 RepID=UPI00032A3403|nr:protein phyllopod [Ceratitis capitata]
MSEKSSEYMKRTCLICGCHTNQTINIYEPRSGPNIVELIQAKFKFQPLNEDKYLCFSCNNWLINWHSLQALNSNDAESPSGTFRPQMNSMLPKEKAENRRQQSHSQLSDQKANKGAYRPIAKVFPWRIISKTPETIKDSKVSTTEYSSFQASTAEQLFLVEGKCNRNSQSEKRNSKCYYTKRKMILKKIRTRRQCSEYNKSQQPFKLPEDTNVADVFKKEIQQKNNCQQTNILSQIRIFGNTNNANTIISHNQSLKRPLVDGKMVSMLRRLGTTLSHENFNRGTSSSRPLLPQIMSPTKSTPHWTRQLDEDEILLDFDSAISEVLPQVIRVQQQKLNDENCMPEAMAVKQAYRSLTYQVSLDEDDSQCVYPVLPEGLSISLV